MTTTNEVARVGDAGQVKLLVIMLDESVHTDNRKCGDSTCPCFSDDNFLPLTISPEFQGMMDSLLVGDESRPAPRVNYRRAIYEAPCEPQETTWYEC